MSTYRFDHLHLRSADPEAAAAFYVSAFGATITNRLLPGGKLRIVLDLSGITMFVEQVPEDTPSPPAPPFLGIEHFGLAVDDLDAALAAMRAQGVTVLSGPTQARPGVRIAFIAAPDDVQVELLERTA